MTQEEIQKKTTEKVKTIQKLCKQLEIQLTAEQVINKDGMIKNVVYFLDTEAYEMDEKAPDIHK